ncbi:MAG: DegV family protein [Clostridia bacterium]|nr:DegV family protein [Clostridia bacterium]
MTNACRLLQYRLVDKTTSEEREKYKEESAEILQGHDVQEYSLGCTIGTHIGPGAVGIAYFVE